MSGVRGLVASGITRVPRIFRVPVDRQDRAAGQELEAAPTTMVPVIDLGGLAAVDCRTAVVAAVRAAASEWGFFQVIGHGVPTRVTDVALQAARAFHEAAGADANDFKARTIGERIPLSSANEDLQPVLAAKRRILALNKKDLANPNIMNRWIDHFESCKQDCISINSHSSSSVNQLLGLVELKLKEAILKEPTLLVMVVGVPNVGKSALINSIHRIANSRFAVNEKIKRATVGPLPGVTQDIAGFKIASQPSIYVLDTPGVLVPSIPDMETGLKLALTGAVKDSVVGEERIAKYLLSLLNIRKTPLHWERLLHRTNESYEETGDSFEKGSRGPLRRKRNLNNSDALYVQDLVMDVQRTLCRTAMEFTGNTEEESELESLIDAQLVALRKVFRIPHKPLDETQGPTSKKLLTLFRSGKLGPFILDDLPGEQ